MINRMAVYKNVKYTILNLK